MSGSPGKAHPQRSRPPEGGSRAAAVAASVRRVREVDLGFQALVLAAQQAMCTIPLVVVLAAIGPTRRASNFGVQFGHYLGLSTQARADLREIFAGPAQVRNGTTLVGFVLLLLFTAGVAQAHQRGMQLAWNVRDLPPRAWVRQARWVGGLCAYVAALAALSRLLGGIAAHRALFIALCAPVSLAFYLWTQRLLLAGRVYWRELVPGAAITAVGLTALLAASPWFLSTQITSGVHEFGLAGVMFALATFQLIAATIILGGAALGAGLVAHQRKGAKPLS